MKKNDPAKRKESGGPSAAGHCGGFPREWLDNFPAAVYQTDRAGRCVYVNRNWCSIAGMSGESALGEGWVKALHPDDRQLIRSNWDKMVSSGGKWGQEYRFQSPDGKITWVLGYAAPVYGSGGGKEGYTGINIDITSRKIAEEALAESEKRYRLLAENVQDVIWTMDLSLRITYVSPSIHTLLGYTSGEVMAMEFLGYMTPESVERVSGTYAGEIRKEKQGVTGRRAIRTAELEFIKKDGTRVWVEARAAFLRGPEGRAEGILGVTRDINERKKVENMLKESEAGLKSQKLSLEQKNLALREIIEYIELEKSRIKNDVAKNMGELVFPLLYKLEKEGCSARYVSLIRKHLEEIAGSFGRGISDSRARLTPREIEVCSMIRGGLSSKEIAGMLSISHQTVDIHRKNIRRKLKIRGKGVNLVSFLKKL